MYYMYYNTCYSKMYHPKQQSINIQFAMVVSHFNKHIEEIYASPLARG